MINDKFFEDYFIEFNSANLIEDTDSARKAYEEFFHRYYVDDAIFTYIPTATASHGLEVVDFWLGVHAIMTEEIQPHTCLLFNDTNVALESPIDFTCKQDLEWVGEKHKAGEKFRLMMSTFYDFDKSKEKFTAARVYSIYNPAYKPK